jgi:serine/threonine protein kinase
VRSCETCGACFEDGLDLCSYDGGTLLPVFPGSRVLGDRYLLEQRVDAGAMGIVFRATHLQVGSTIAVKVMRPEREDLRVALVRFRREAQILGQVKHPNAVMVMDFGVEERGPTPVAYLVTEFLRGESLEDLLERQPVLSLAEVEEILSPVCEAVEEAHQAGVVHRDIKPSNIFLEQLRDGTRVVKVLDFGIAKFVERVEEGDVPPGLEALDQDFLEEVVNVRRNVEAGVRPRRAPTVALTTHAPGGSITEHGAMVGTVAYMAPEQVSGRRLCRQTDTYSLATLAFRLLAGRLPFDGDDDDVIQQKLSGEQPTLGAAGVVVDAALEECLASCLAQDPGQRPDSVLEVAQALKRARAVQGGGPAPGDLGETLEATLALVQRVGEAARQWDTAADQEEPYQRARDGILALEGTLRAVQRATEVTPRPDPPPARVVDAVRFLELELGHVGRLLHGLTSASPRGAPEYVEYLVALWTRLSGRAHHLVTELKARVDRPPGPSGSAGLASLFPGPLAGADAGLEDLAERLLGADSLDSAEALEQVVAGQAEAVTAYLARAGGRGDALAERLVAGLWRHADALLLQELRPAARPLRVLPLLAALQGVRAARHFTLLATLFGWRGPGDCVTAARDTAASLPDDESRRVLWRCLLLHPDATVRDDAATHLPLAEFWPVVVHPHTPIQVVRAVFQAVRPAAPPEYLKVFFLCVRDNLAAASHHDDVAEAFRLLGQFFSVPCFHEDVVFEPLLEVDRVLRARSAALGEQVVPESAYEESLAGFSAEGVTDTQAPTSMRDVPLPVQRRLARQGHFLVYFSCHANERVARETLPHLLHMEDVTRFLRLPSIHRAVLVELTKTKRFFRQESARLALLQNPKTPAHVARLFLPFVPHEQVRLLSANRHVGADVRALASAMVTKIEKRTH